MYDGASLSTRAPSRGVLLLLLVLFAASGCSALIYEVVWLQLLQLSIGSTAVSVGLLLATFMGGMCLGSIAFPRLLCGRYHPLRIYALLELGIGICAIAILFWPQPILLVPPTVLMGASLPAVSRWLETTPQGVSWLGLLYGANIAGAVLGSVLAGFYLLRVHDVATATLSAAAINTLVALGAFALAMIAPATPVLDGDAPPAGSRAVYITIALSGLCALGAEVIWTRLLSLMLGATVYTFSIILAVFLLGLGIGSAAGSLLSRRVANPRIALGCCQVLLAAAIAWAAFAIARSLPYWRINPAFATTAWPKFRIDFVRCLWAILPATCLWGASFPLALAAAARRAQDPGRLVGRVYAANTIGAIAGALAFSLLIIPAVGTQQAQRILIALSALAALCALPLRVTSAAGALAFATLLAWCVPAVPWGVIAYGRSLPTKTSPGQLLYLGEGMNGSIAITESSGTRMFHVSGKVEASSEAQDMRLERMLGHLPALLHPKARSVLVVGCGAGVTAGAFVTYPDVERIIICEIERLIPPAAARYFAHENHGVLHDPRVQVVYDDARHYILNTREQFDIITSDPIHPWVKGSATLYTREYFDLCKRHLKPGGVITQWVPLYESTPETVKSEIATFFEAFPNGTIWGNDTVFEEGYDTVLLGQTGAARIDVDGLEQRLGRADHLRAAQSLRDVGFRSAVQLLSTYAGHARDLRRWLQDAQINRDRNLRLQYLAGLAPDAQGALVIYEQILRHRRFPEELFVATEARKQALRNALRWP
jgi:spermidine synthase